MQNLKYVNLGRIMKFIEDIEVFLHFHLDPSIGIKNNLQSSMKDNVNN